MLGSVLVDIRPGKGGFVELRPGRGCPLFMLPPASGAALNYTQLASLIRADTRVVAYESPEIHGPCVFGDELDMAQKIAARLGSEYPDGPLTLGGFSFGCIAALEIGRILHAAGREVRGLLLIDPGSVRTPEEVAASESATKVMQRILPTWQQPPPELEAEMRELRDDPFRKRFFRALFSMPLSSLESNVDTLVDVWELANLRPVADRAALHALGNEGAIAWIFGEANKLRDLGDGVNGGDLFGGVIRRISDDPLMIFRVLRTIGRSFAMGSHFRPGPPYAVRAAIIHRKENQNITVWQNTVSPPARLRALGFVDHLGLIDDPNVLALAVEELERLIEAA